MIDTIVLLLPEHTFTITDHDTLTRNSRAVHGIQIYQPRLVLFSRENKIWLKIELSLPKLFFGNNFQELKGKDLPTLLQKLSTVLAQMGIRISVTDLTKASVSAIHYSKNIPLTDGSTPYHYITKIKEANTKLSLDTNQTDYRNEGHSYKWHCNSYEVVFYDKIKDLEKAYQSEKRAIEKDSATQLNFFPQLAKRKKLEILRMEVRLNKRAKMRQLFKKLGIKSSLTFKSLFKPGISKKILLYYLDELESKRPLLLDYKATNDKALLTALIMNNPDLGPKRILQLFGLSKALEGVTLRELRGMFPKYNQKGWNRLMAEIKEVKVPEISSALGIIRSHLIKFKSLNLRLH